MKQLLDKLIMTYCEFVRDEDKTNHDLIMELLRIIIVAYVQNSIELPLLPEYMEEYFSE